MQLNITTDYAIRTLLYLGNESQSRTAKEISEMMCIPEKYLIKVLAKLRKGGFIKSSSGYGGGYQLKKELSDILIRDVFNITEKTIKVNRCLEEGESCSRKATKTCPMRRVYEAFQKDLEERWMAMSIQYIQDTYSVKE